MIRASDSFRFRLKFKQHRRRIAASLRAELVPRYGMTGFATLLCLESSRGAFEKLGGFSVWFYRFGKN